jgi:hypothetical protein
MGPTTDTRIVEGSELLGGDGAVVGGRVLVAVGKGRGRYGTVVAGAGGSVAVAGTDAAEAAIRVPVIS